MDWKRLLAHPIAMQFPEIDADTYVDLKRSMRERGYCAEHPIVLFEGRVLDGRNRLRAARETNTTPVVRVYDGDYAGAIELAIRENLHRRHLTAGQRAIIADSLSAMLSVKYPITLKNEDDRVRGTIDPLDRNRNRDGTYQTEAGRAVRIDDAARLTHVAPRTLKRARELRALNPAAVDRVREGKETLSGALTRARRAAKMNDQDSTSWAGATDGAGLLIPPRSSRALTEGAAEARRLLNAVRALRRDVLAYAGGEFGRLLHAQSIETDFRNIERALRYSTPYTSCPLGDPCDDGCVQCRGQQWIGEMQWEAVPAEMKRSIKLDTGD